MLDPELSVDAGVDSILASSSPLPWCVDVDVRGLRYRNGLSRQLLAALAGLLPALTAAADQYPTMWLLGSPLVAQDSPQASPLVKGTSLVVRDNDSQIIQPYNRFV